MREILAPAADWLDEGRPFALAVVVEASASAPREVGTGMIVAADGTVFGNASAGCVDAAVHELCTEAIASVQSRRVRYGIPDDTAFAVGLSCGGIIDVLVIPVLPGSGAARTLRDLSASVAARETCGLGVVVDGPPEVFGTLILHSTDTALDRAARVAEVPGGAVESDLRRVADQQVPVLLRYPNAAGELVVLGIGFPHPPRLIIVGAVEFSVALARLGAASGFEVTVCDPREVFAAPTRFPEADVVHRWPHEYLAQTPIDARTAICVLTHDDRFDVPALAIALRSPAGYVGAMGSRRTHDDRARRLREAGVTDDEAGRLRSPIGLALGGRSPEETALSILAEIVMLRAGGDGMPLRETIGPIHLRRAGDSPGFSQFACSSQPAPHHVAGEDPVPRV